MEFLFSAWLRAVDRVMRPRFYAHPRTLRSGAPKLPRIEDVLARAGREPPIAD